MNIFVPTYEEIKEIDFWVPPQPDSLMLTVTTHVGKKIKIDILPEDDEDEEMEYVGIKIYSEKIRIYINTKPIELKSNEEAKVLTLLTELIDNDRLGHKQGEAVLTAKAMIEFFRN